MGKPKDATHPAVSPGQRGSNSFPLASADALAPRDGTRIELTKAALRPAAGYEPDERPKTATFQCSPAGKDQAHRHVVVLGGPAMPLDPDGEERTWRSSHRAPCGRRTRRR